MWLKAIAAVNGDERGGDGAKKRGEMVIHDKRSDGGTR